MRIDQVCANMTALEKERFIGRIEGLEFARRICFNQQNSSCHPEAQKKAAVIREFIRQYMHKVGSGKESFGPLVDEEFIEIWRIE